MINEKDSVIDLLESNLPSTIKEGAFVQKGLKTRLKKEIKTFVAISDNESAQDESGRNVFFIDGTRGAGKTTFLTRLLSDFESNDEPDVIAIGSIDPTKLPNVEPILVTVIAKLNTMVEKKIKTTCRWDDDKGNKKEWKKQLETLGKSIKLLNAKEWSNGYYDESLYVDSKLSYSTSGQFLAKHFNELLSLACNILEKKALLVAFDDIDTKFETGWAVLEAIRQYFGSSKLVILITGDLRLYSQLIRGKQYENYSRVLLEQEKDGERFNERLEMVEHLEQQYLLKLVPVYRRFALKTLRDISDTTDKLRVKTKIDAEPKEFKEAVSIMLSEGLNLAEGTDLQLYVNELLSQPIRLVMQLLQGYYQGKNYDTSQSNVVLFSSVVRSTMLSSIYKVGLNYESHRENIGALSKDVFKFTRLDGDTDTGFYLRPQSGNEYIKNSAIYLSARVAESTECSLHNSLYLMLVGCGSVTLFEQLNQRLDTIKIDRIKGDLEDSYIKYLGIGRQESLTHWANRVSAVIAGVDINNKGIHTGLIRLNSPRSGKTGAYSNKKEKNTFSSLCIGMASNDILGSSLNSFISLFNLIAAIADVLKAASLTEVIDNKFLKYQLIKNSSIATNAPPSWSKVNDTVEKYDVLDEDDSSDEEIVDDYINAVRDWLDLVRNVEKKIKPNSILIGKIWTRLYFNLANIAEEHRKNVSNGFEPNVKKSTDTNAAKIMRFNVISLLHAVMHEENIYHKKNDERYDFSKIESGNPLKTISIFYKKLKVLFPSGIEAGINVDDVSLLESRMPIFYCLINCPFLYPFLFSEGSFSNNKVTNSQEAYIRKLVELLMGKKLNLETIAIKFLNTASIVSMGAPVNKGGNTFSEGDNQ